MRNILTPYGFEVNDCTILPFGNGLINHTWLLEIKTEKFILQKINQQIFKSPENIAFNIHLIAGYLKQFHPEYLFVTPVKTLAGEELLATAEGYFRVFPFVNGSHSMDVVEKPEQAFEAARQFAGFTKRLSGLDPGQLTITLPDFHNLTLRHQQFEQALLDGNKERINQSKDMIQFIRQQKSIVDEFEYCTANFHMRCTHHDAKISNVLFDEHNRGLCVIDLDTVMPGYFISDVGDMMRTYLSPVSEEEKDFSTIKVRKEFYDAIVEGYLSQMKDELSDIEKEHFLFAGKFMTYMQALRFLTDHINNDIYYGAKYEDHNFVRAGNQIVLLQKIIEFEKQF